MENTYIALTIGPIYNTFNQVKRTRAVWAASYFFSWFIKNLAYRAHEAGLKVLLPYLKPTNGKPSGYKDVTFESKFGSGLYADRIYFEPSTKTKEDLETIVKAIIAEIAISIDKGNANAVESYLNEYLNYHIIEAEISDKKNVLQTLNDLLDQQELKQSYAFENEHNYLLEYFESKRVLDNDILSKDAFGEYFKKRGFRSIPEIATTTLSRLEMGDKYIKSLIADFKNEDVELIDKLKENGFKILPYHKYYAVLYADGDYVGKLLKSKSDNFDELRELSKQLFEFGTKVEEVIAQYGGNGIYLGGEDILAFLPVACITKDKSQTQTIFQVIQQIDDCFASTLGNYAKLHGVNPPTLSYGIMLSYIKHPLKESMHEAYDLMDKLAKKMQGKNSIGLKFQKHSGQFTKCCIEKSKTCSWDYIKCLVEEYTKQIGDIKENKTKADLLSGVIHRFNDDLFFELFIAAARANRLEPFFDNFFNENIHKGDDNPKNTFLKKVRELSEKVFNDYPNNKDCKDIIFTVLRFIHFINSTRE